MKRLLMTATAVSLIAAAGLAQAQDGQAQAKESGCLKCHTLDSKKTGPAIRKIAADYKKKGLSGDKAVAKMKEMHEPEDLEKVKSDADLKAALGYFLSQ